MSGPTSTVVELYNEVGQRGSGDDFREYHVRLYHITLYTPGSLGLWLNLYLYHFTDTSWGEATEENNYRPRRTSRTKIVRTGLASQHIRKAIAYVDAFTGPAEEKRG